MAKEMTLERKKAVRAGAYVVCRGSDWRWSLAGPQISASHDGKARSARKAMKEKARK